MFGDIRYVRHKFVVSCICPGSVRYSSVLYHVALSRDSRFSILQSVAAPYSGAVSSQKTGNTEIAHS